MRPGHGSAGGIRIRATLVLVALATALATVPASPAEGLHVPHPPIRIVGDAGFLAPGSGVVGGSGTAADPYVVEGWAFAVPASEPLTQTATVAAAAAVTIEATDAHVVVRGNLFVGAPRPAVPSGGTSVVAPMETPPGVSIRSARNVTVEGNEFRDVGGALGAVAVRKASHVGSLAEFLAKDALPAPSDRPSLDVRIVGNSFLGGHRPAIAVSESQADIVGNLVRMDTRACCMHNSMLELQRVLTPFLVGGNVIEYERPDAFGQSVSGIRVDQILDRGTVTVRGNTVSGALLGGLSLSATNFINGGRGGSFVVEDNSVDVGGSCATVYAHDGGLMRGNSFRNCRGISLATGVVADDTNTFNDGRMLYLRGVEDAVVDGTGVSWLDARDLRNVTLRGFDLLPEAAPSFVYGHGVAVEDSTFRASHNEALLTWGEATELRRVTLSSTARFHPALTFYAWGDARLEDVTVRGSRDGIVIPALSARDPAHVRVLGGSFEGVARSALWVGSTLHALDVEGATFRGNGVGVEVAGPASVTIRDASFVANAEAGVRSASATVDARSSWWGDASGPRAEGNPSGLGDAVVGPVLFDPWLTSPP